MGAQWSPGDENQSVRHESRTQRSRAEPGTGTSSRDSIVAGPPSDASGATAMLTAACAMRTWPALDWAWSAGTAGGVGAESWLQWQPVPADSVERLAQQQHAT